MLLAMKLPFFHHRPWARRVAGGLIGVVLLWALGWLLVPPLLRSQGEKIATEKLGRTVSIGRVDFRPWTLELSLHDVAIAGADGAESAGAQVQIQRLYIDAALQSLWRGAPVLDGIEIDRHRKMPPPAGRWNLRSITWCCAVVRWTSLTPLSSARTRCAA